MIFLYMVQISSKQGGRKTHYTASVFWLLFKQTQNALQDE